MPAPASVGDQLPPVAGVPVKALNNCVVVRVLPAQIVKVPLPPAFGCVQQGATVIPVFISSSVTFNASLTVSVTLKLLVLVGVKVVVLLFE